MGKERRNRALRRARQQAAVERAPLRGLHLWTLTGRLFLRALELGPGEPSLTLMGETLVARVRAEDLPHVLADLEDGAFPSFSFRSLVYTGGQTLALAGDWLGIE